MGKPICTQADPTVEWAQVALDVYDFYARCLMPLAPHASVSRILEHITSGAETTDDFARVVALDAEVQHWLRLTVQRLGFDKRISRVDQMVTLIGQNRIRDLILGRHIERAFIKEPQTLLGELKVKAEKDKKEHDKKAPPKKSAEPAATAPGAAAAADKVEEIPPAPEEVIPAIADFQRYLSFANRAEEVAISIRNSYPGQAFSGGVIFDYLKYFLKTLDLSKITDPRIAKTDEFVEDIFTDGLRCGIAANEILQKISIPHQKIVLMTALLHNIGKALLLAYDPLAFERAFQLSTGAKDARLKVESIEAEIHEFDFDHAQAGALFLGRMSFTVEVERSVDYHHNPSLLRFSNPGLYAMACMLRVSGALAKLYERSRAQDPNVERIPDGSLIKTPDFEFLKLSEKDWNEIKANYALKLLKVGL